VVLRNNASRPRGCLEVDFHCPGLALVLKVGVLALASVLEVSAVADSREWARAAPY